MALFFHDDEHVTPGVRKVGFPRYREVLEGNWKEFLLVGFLTLLWYIPLAAGMVYAILSKSSLVAIGSGILGGAIVGPGLACLYDLILRRLRDDKAHWGICYKRSLRQNWRASLLPGIVQHLFLALIVYSEALVLWGARQFSFGTLALMALGGLLLKMLLNVWWCQVVLFDQKLLLRLKNCIFFCLFHPGRALGAALIQLVWLAVLFLLLPWSAFAVPVLGIWYTTFLAVFLLYRPMDKDFQIEDQIREAFPGKLPPEEYRP